MRVNKAITVVAGTPIQISTLKVYASRVFIQMKTGGTGNGQVMDGQVTQPTGHGATAGQLTAEIAAASASAPGGSYADRAYEKDGTGIDLSQLWVDGDHSGDIMTVSYDQRV